MQNDMILIFTQPVRQTDKPFTLKRNCNQMILSAILTGMRKSNVSSLLNKLDLSPSRQQAK